MVATWIPAANAGYYSKQTAYYAHDGGVEPRGLWYAPACDHGVRDGSVVETGPFERLFSGKDADGRSLITTAAGRIDRVPAFDVTLSAPRSVSLVWALSDLHTREVIEAVHAKAVRQTLDMLEREATFARRGRGGQRLERVALTAATFRHGESRPAEHADGLTFADPNLHTHCVILNLAQRDDGSIGALHSTVLREWKMAAGAVYHAALAAGVMEAGLTLDRIGKNGTFEISCIGEDAIQYFSARRQEIIAELEKVGHSSGDAVALAAMAAKTTRSEKSAGAVSRDEVWRTAALRIGFDTGASYLLAGRTGVDRQIREALLSSRLAGLPDRLTENSSVFQRRDLVRAVGEAFVGTGVGAEHIRFEVDRVLADGLVVEIGRDRLNLPRYSTPEMIRIEREIVEMSAALAARPGFAVDQQKLRVDCGQKGLSEEQTAAVLDAARSQSIAVVEGAPGTGKTTLLLPVVEAWKRAGYCVVGAASAWRVANALHDDLAIEARATASWLARARQGKPFLDERTVVIVDEAGLLSSRDMHDLLSTARDAGAKVLLVGDRDQLQAIGAGSGLRLVTRAVDTAQVKTIVRQHDRWAREAVLAFGAGDPKAALNEFSAHGLLTEADGQKAAIRAAVDRVEDRLLDGHPNAVLILAKTNAEVAAIGREVRDRLKNRGIVAKDDVPILAVTPSGHTNRLALARGDRVRFLVRNDELGVVNGTVGTISKVFAVNKGAPTSNSSTVMVKARIGKRDVCFSTSDIADEHGRARLGWAYASTIYGAQGMTVDKAAVLLTPSFDRHDIYVAASRARKETLLVVDRVRINNEMGAGGAKLDEPDQAGRREWLAERLAIQHIKETTLDSVSMLLNAGNATNYSASVSAVSQIQQPRGANCEIAYGL